MKELTVWKLTTLAATLLLAWSIVVTATLITVIEREREEASGFRLYHKRYTSSLHPYIKDLEYQNQMYRQRREEERQQQEWRHKRLRANGQEA